MYKNEYDEIYEPDKSYGFEFNYSKKHLGKSKSMSKNDISKIDSSKHNNDDEFPLFVKCKGCNIHMDFMKGPLGVVDSWWICPLCGARVKESTVYRTLEKENEEWLVNNVYDEEPECCVACDGPWPECQSGCRLFRD